MPGGRHDAGQLAFFNVQHTHVVDVGQTVLLEVDGLVFAMLVNGGIVQVGNSFQAPDVGFFVKLGLTLGAHPVFTKGQGTVGIEKIRLEGVDHFLHAAQPVVLESFVGGVPGENLLRLLGAVFFICMIKIPVLGIVAVIRHTGIGAVLVAALVHAPPGEGSTQVLADAKGHAEFIRRSLPQGQNILLGAHVLAVHPVQLGIVVEEVIVMGALAHEITGTGIVVFFHQPFGVKLFRFPQGTDVFIAEFGRMAIVAHMVFILLGALDVHVPGIPVAKHGDALGAPVAPDAEFGIPEPFGSRILAQ